MADWYPRQTPAHPKTDLRISVSREGGRYGRTRVDAHDGERLVYTSIYDWAKWEGHASGSLLMPAFVAAAEGARVGASCSHRYAAPTWPSSARASS